MPTIPFTQYMMPNGRKVPMQIEQPPEIVAKAEALIAAGFRFECEVLSTGVVSFTVFGKDPKTGEEDDLDIELAVNGPPTVEAVAKLVERAHSNLVL